jgi:hypothetical protein
MKGMRLVLRLHQPALARLAEEHAAAAGGGHRRDHDPQAGRDDQGFQLRHGGVRAEQLDQHGGQEEGDEAQRGQDARDEVRAFGHDRVVDGGVGRVRQSVPCDAGQVASM